MRAADALRRPTLAAEPTRVALRGGRAPVTLTVTGWGWLTDGQERRWFSGVSTALEWLVPVDAPVRFVAWNAFGWSTVRLVVAGTHDVPLAHAPAAAAPPAPEPPRAPDAPEWPAPPRSAPPPAKAASPEPPPLGAARAVTSRPRSFTFPRPQVKP